MGIRPATVDDAGSIASVHVRSWQSAYVGQLPDEYLAGLSAGDREPMWREILGASALPSAGALVLEEAGRIIGFAHVCPSRDDSSDGVGEVTSIYLDPQAWDRGHGRRLMAEALAQLRQAGFAEATLWVLDTNRRARSFYEAGGWELDGAEKLDERDGLSLRELRYRLTL